jgi:hypothetical protein
MCRMVKIQTNKKNEDTVLQEGKGKVSIYNICLWKCHRGWICQCLLNEWMNEWAKINVGKWVCREENRNSGPGLKGNKFPNEVWN